MRRFVYAAFLVYFALIGVALAFGKTGSALFNGGVLLVFVLASLFFQKDEFSWPLFAAAVLFIIPFIAGLFFGYVMQSSFLGIDKVFHAAGGAILAWFVALVLKDYIKHKVVFAFCVVALACAIGAWWEVYEWVMLALKNDTVRLTLSDSLLDIVADTLGAVVVALVYVSRRKR